MIITWKRGTATTECLLNKIISLKLTVLWFLHNNMKISRDKTTKMWLVVCCQRGVNDTQRHGKTAAGFCRQLENIRLSQRICSPHSNGVRFCCKCSSCFTLQLLQVGQLWQRPHDELAILRRWVTLRLSFRLEQLTPAPTWFWTHPTGIPPTAEDAPV